MRRAIELAEGGQLSKAAKALVEQRMARLHCVQGQLLWLAAAAAAMAAGGVT